jgi:hypothetical protein
MLYLPTNGQVKILAFFVTTLPRADILYRHLFSGKYGNVIIAYAPLFQLSSFLVFYVIQAYCRERIVKHEILYLYMQIFTFMILTGMTFKHSASCWKAP